MAVEAITPNAIGPQQETSISSDALSERLGKFKEIIAELRKLGDSQLQEPLNNLELLLKDIYGENIYKSNETGVDLTSDSTDTPDSMIPQVLEDPDAELDKEEAEQVKNPPQATPTLSELEAIAERKGIAPSITYLDPKRESDPEYVAATMAHAENDLKSAIGEDAFSNELADLRKPNIDSQTSDDLPQDPQGDNQAPEISGDLRARLYMRAEDYIREITAEKPDITPDELAYLLRLRILQDMIDERSTTNAEEVSTPEAPKPFYPVEELKQDSEKIAEVFNNAEGSANFEAIVGKIAQLMGIPTEKVQELWKKAEDELQIDDRLEVAYKAVAAFFEKAGIETEKVQLGNDPMQRYTAISEGFRVLFTVKILKAIELDTQEGGPTQEDWTKLQYDLGIQGNQDRTLSEIKDGILKYLGNLYFDSDNPNNPHIFVSQPTREIYQKTLKALKSFGEQTPANNFKPIEKRSAEELGLPAEIPDFLLQSARDMASEMERVKSAPGTKALASITIEGKTYLWNGSRYELKTPQRQTFRIHSS